MDFEGRVIQFIGETNGVSKAGNPWKKKEWVVENLGSQYPRKVKLQCFGDRSDLINLEAGRDYKFTIDIESREYQGRWYTDVSVLRVDEPTGQGAMPQGGFQQPQSNFGGAPFGNPSGEPFGGDAFGGGTASSDNSDEDLPF